MFWRGEATLTGWLDTQLPQVDTPWTVLFAHHPLRSNGTHGNAGSYEGWRWLPWASGEAVARLYDRVCPHADLLLTGHDHSLQHLESCGAQLVVSGSGSSPRPLVDRGNLARFEQGTAGFAWIELGATGRILFFDRQGALLYESAAFTPRAR